MPRPFLDAVRLFALLAGLCACSPGEETRPDVILIVVDTLRADHLSHYGYDHPTAAPLDGFAEVSTRFERCHAPAPWTVPSVASLLSGLFTARHGMNTGGSKFGEDALLLPEVLQQHGWSTGGFSANPHISEPTRFDQGFDHFEGFAGKALAYPDITEMVAGAKEWLDGVNRPFFLYLQPMNVHGPYRVPDDRRSELLGRPPGEEFRYLGEPMNGILKGKVEQRADVSPEYVRSLTEQYDAAVRYTMDVLAELFDELRRRGVFDSSLIVLTSDHGEELFDHGGFSHGYSLHEEVLHVPLYVKLPFQTKGATVAESVGLTDVFPTLLDVLDLDVDVPLDGRSLLPHLTGSRGAAPSPRLHETAWRKRCIARSIVEDGYKLIVVDANYEGRRDVEWLFELDRDPDEAEDLSEARPEVAARLRRSLTERFDAFSAQASSVPENVIEELDRERLEALGYSGDD